MPAFYAREGSVHVASCNLTSLHCRILGLRFELHSFRTIEQPLKREFSTQLMSVRTDQSRTYRSCRNSLNVDKGDVGILAILDLSAAFNTVDHVILPRRLQQTFGVDGTAHRWFRLYLHGRTQYVRRGNNRLSTISVYFAVYRRDQSSDRFCSFSTLSTSSR